MKKIKLLLLIACFAACSNVANAQSGLTIEASQLYTSFNFTDSQGNNLSSEYSGIFTGSYGFGYSYLADFGLMVRTGIGMRNGGANLVYDDMNYSWRLKYADVKLGLGYNYEIDMVNPYFIAYGYYAYLLDGTQILNNEIFDITQSGTLSNMDYGVIFAPGVEFVFSDFAAAFLEFRYLWGLQNIEIDELQKTTNVAYGLTLGVSFMLN